MPNSDSKATDDQQKANTLNDICGSVFTQDDNEEEAIGPFTDEHMKKIEVTEEKVMKKLEKLKTTKSPGPDMIHPKVMFEIRESIVKPLTFIFKQSIENSELPQDWRDAHISAIFKKGIKKSPNNYRPVSLTSISCKLLESIVKDDMYDHMKDHKLFSNKQFGFLKGRSTSYQLLTTLEKWTDIMDNSGNIDVIYFDLMKAFDKVPHLKLLSKLTAYGIDSKTTGWVKSFLKNRRQRVKWSKKRSQSGRM